MPEKLKNEGIQIAHTQGKKKPNKNQTQQTNHQPQKIKPAKIQQTRENNSKNIFTGSKGKKKQ